MRVRFSFLVSNDFYIHCTSFPRGTTQFNCLGLMSFYLHVLAKPCQISRKTEKSALHVLSGEDKIPNTSPHLRTRQEKDLQKRCCGALGANNFTITDLAWWSEEQTRENWFYGSCAATYFTKAEGHSFSRTCCERQCCTKDGRCDTWRFERPSSDHQGIKGELQTGVSLYDTCCG